VPVGRACALLLIPAAAAAVVVIAEELQVAIFMIVSTAGGLSKTRCFRDPQEIFCQPESFLAHFSYFSKIYTGL
jgi:hypothetical protein